MSVHPVAFFFASEVVRLGWFLVCMCHGASTSAWPHYGTTGLLLPLHLHRFASCFPAKVLENCSETNGCAGCSRMNDFGIFSYQPRSLDAVQSLPQQRQTKGKCEGGALVTKKCSNKGFIADLSDLFAKEGHGVVMVRVGVTSSFTQRASCLQCSENETK